MREETAANEAGLAMNVLTSFKLVLKCREVVLLIISVSTKCNLTRLLFSSKDISCHKLESS